MKLRETQRNQGRGSSHVPTANSISSFMTMREPVEIDASKCLPKRYGANEMNGTSLSVTFDLPSNWDYVRIPAEGLMAPPFRHQIG